MGSHKSSLHISPNTFSKNSLQIGHNGFSERRPYSSFTKSSSCISRNSLISSSFIISQNFLPSRRLISHHGVTWVAKRRVDKLMVRDGVGPEYQLVFRLGLDNYLTTAKWVGLAASVGFLVCFPLTLLSTHQGPIYLLGTDQTLDASNRLDLIVLNFVLAAHAVACLYVTRVAPLRIYYSKKGDHFMVLTNTWIPWRCKLVRVKPGELVQVDKKNDLMNLNHHRHIITTTGQVVYLPVNCFSTNHYYRKMTGTSFEDDNDDDDL